MLGDARPAPQHPKAFANLGSASAALQAHENLGVPPGRSGKYYLVVTPAPGGQPGLYDNLEDYTANVIDPAEAYRHHCGQKIPFAPGACGTAFWSEQAVVAYWIKQGWHPQHIWVHYKTTFDFCAGYRPDKF